ncbi:MAG TPA: DNA mismatch repair endonuclease MutL [Anaerolineae bacterium]|nr:DNA mismatch repair endonuclease MutL [Anaerolineae bacterium]HNS49750.1 DNA mismatch repair endonuclease MutL [Anaerolineae bacterium]
MPIHLLTAEVAGKIAAGEVVERPASVVKELIENSVDAGASQIRVEIREGGRRLIRVTDNGCGIPSAEVPLAFARHATSKLDDVGDLDRIATLGFRGEALASIAAVSEVTLLTRPRDQDVGLLLRVDGGQVTHHEGHGCPVGTVVTVEHLFRRIPARAKFLRQPETETGHIYTIVTHYSLAYPEIQFGLTADGRTTFQSPGNGQVRDVLLAVHDLDTVEQLVDVEPPDAPGTRVTGYVGLPSLHRANRSYIVLFVNRRWVQDRSLAHAVVQAYHALLPVGRFPVAFLFLAIDPAEVDVNVHPTKREVRFRDGQRVFATLQRAVRAAVTSHAPVQAPGYAPRSWPGSGWDGQQAGEEAVLGATPATQIAMELYRTADEGEQLQPCGPVRLPLLRVVGQVGQTYIVAEGPQGLYLIDQHAAHERVLYEKMSADHRQHAVTSQALLDPLVLELDPLLSGMLSQHLRALNELGFAIEPFGGTAYLLRAVPPVLGTSDLRAAVVDILEILRVGSDPIALSAEQRLIAAICKRSAVKAGMVLAPEEMQKLVRQLELCELPHTCPHGRPTLLHFSVEQLEKGFARR